MATHDAGLAEGIELQQIQQIFERLVMAAASARDFALNPAAYGLPTRDELVKLRIWDIHYHGFYQGGMKQHEENLFYVERMGVERMLSVDIAGTAADPLGTKLTDEQKREFREYLEKNSERISGLITIDPAMQ